MQYIAGKLTNYNPAKFVFTIRWIYRKYSYVVTVSLALRKNSSAQLLATSTILSRRVTDWLRII